MDEYSSQTLGEKEHLVKYIAKDRVKGSILKDTLKTLKKHVLKI